MSHLHEGTVLLFHQNRTPILIGLLLSRVASINLELSSPLPSHRHENVKTNQKLLQIWRGNNPNTLGKEFSGILVQYYHVSPSLL